MGLFCSKDDAPEVAPTMIVGGPSNAGGCVDADSAIIAAGIGQLRGAGVGAFARGGTDPEVFFGGDRFDACNLTRRMAFHPATLETVVFSGPVRKINKRGKRQDRVFVCTDQAFYNMDPKDGGSKCLRRIALHNIGRLYVNRLHTSCLLRVTNSYDYIFLADKTIVDAFACLVCRCARQASIPGSTTYEQRAEDDLWPLCVKKGDDNGKEWKRGGRVR